MHQIEMFGNCVPCAPMPLQQGRRQLLVYEFALRPVISGIRNDVYNIYIYIESERERERERVSDCSSGCLFRVSPDGLLNDFLQLDFSTNNFSSMQTRVQGSPPAARYGHGFTTVNSRLWVLGGSGYSGKYDYLTRRHVCNVITRPISRKLLSTFKARSSYTYA